MFKIRKVCRTLLASVAFVSLSAYAEFVPADRQLDGVTLPDGYALLPFVSSTGSQYVDLDVTPDETVAYEVTLRNDNVDPAYSQQVFGARTAYEDHAFAFSIQHASEPKGTGWAWHLANQIHFSAKFYSDFNVVSFDAQHCVSVNGEREGQLDIGDASATTGLNFYLFTVNNNGTPHNQYAKVSVRRFKLWKGGELVRDCVGARDSEGKIGLCDLVSGGFFKSKTSSSLIAGIVVTPVERILDGVSLPEGYTLLEYVSAQDKGPYVDTGIYPDGTTRYELAASLGNENEQFLLGSRDFDGKKWGFFAALSGKVVAGGYSTTVAAQKSTITPGGFQVWSFSSADRLQRLDGIAVNDFSALSWPSGVTSTHSIYLFALNNAGTVHANKSVMSVRRLRIWQGTGDTPALDYVPAKFGDEVGFYDLVAEKFVKPVTGSGSLTAGPEVIAEPEDEPGDDPEAEPEVDPDPTLAYAANGNRGVVTATVGGSASASGTEQKVGSAVVLTATPADGYEFSYWSGTLPDGASPTANPLAFEMPDASVSLSAHFVTTNRVVPVGWTDPSHGVLLITFDDNAVDSWLAATNLLARYDAHASFAVIGDPSGYGSNGSKLMALKARGHTVGLHTWGHKNTDGFESNPQRYFEEQVKPQLDKFTAMGHACTYMAYPNNKRTEPIDEYIRKHSSIRHLRAGEVASDSSSPYWHAAAAGKDLVHNDVVFTPVAELAEMSVLNGMGCAVQQYGTSVDVVKAGLGRIAANNEVMVLFSHDIQNSPSTVGMSPTMLEDILATAKELGVRVVGADEIPYVPVESEAEPEEPEEPETPEEPGEPEEPIEPEEPGSGDVTLPSGYDLLEYVESTGLQYIDLRLKPDDTMTCSLGFSYLGGETDAVFFLGSRKAFQDHAFYLTHQSVAHNDTRGFCFARGDKIVCSELHDAGDHTASLTANKEFVLDGATIGDISDTAAVANDHSIYLFTINNAGAPSAQAAKMRFYSCVIRKAGEIVRSLVPARHFGVAGVYDLVEGRFYAPKPVSSDGKDADVGGLLAGPQKTYPAPNILPSGYTQLAYVSSHGTELLNTEIVPDDKTEMYARLMPHDDKDVHMVGSRKAFGGNGQMFGLSNNSGFRMCFGSTNKDSGRKHLEEMVEIAFYEKRFFVKGLQYGDFSGEGAFVGAGPMFVFTLNDNGSPHAQFATIDLAELQIFTNGAPARALVAAENAQGTPGLYDFVSERFFTCSQGALTAGPEEIVETDEIVEFAGERYENDTLLLTVTRQRSRFAATDITLAYGSEIGGETVADWAGSRVVGRFDQGQNRIELAIADLPASARFGRFFTTNGSSEPIEIFTILGRYGRPSLPSGYREVEYIRSGTLQCGYIIDTGYVHLRQTRIECIADVEKTPSKKESGEDSGWAALFGSRVGSAWTPAGGYAFFALDDSAFVPRYNRSGDKVVGTADTFPYGTKVRVVTQGDKAEWFAEPSGEKLGELTTTAKVDDGVNTMAIFDLNDSSTPGGFNVSGSTAVMKLYSFRMIDSGHVSRDFVPCLNEYGEPGLYEAVTGEFHGNMGHYPGVDFETDLPTTEATYTWTGKGASADWSDAGNWESSNEAAGGAPGWTSSVIIPSGTWTINVDRPVGVRSLDISAADLALTLSSVTNRKLIVNSDIVLHAGSSLCLARNVGLCGRRTEDFTADGAGCVVEVKNGSELVFDDIVVGGAGSRLVVDDGRVASTNAEGGLFVRTTGNAVTDGLWVRGGHPIISSANNLRPDAADAVLPIHFVVPVGGYAEAPIRSEGTGRCFSEWNDQAQAFVSGPTIVYIDAKSPILKTQCSLDVPLVSFPNGKIAAEYTQFASVPQRNPKRESFFYWTKDGDGYHRTTSEDQHTLNAHIEGCTSGLVVVLF